MRFEMEFVIWRDKQEIDILLCPTGADHSARARDYFSEAAFLDRDKACVTPERRGWIERKRHVLIGTHFMTALR
ncbi:MAG: hypothetical protein DMG77_09910 [Acidobacteria bacterium]|nr:MAG: hypothetical protein DMG77_09910 [Acidobacteriota bacterium]